MAVDTDLSVLEGSPLNLLSLDGGGIRGVSELLVLDEIIMRRIQTRKNLSDAPKPCEYFDLIGGSGTGGLVAIMLGRLKMSTAEALRCYNTLSSVVFGATKHFSSNSKFKATTLEKEMKKVIVQAGYMADQKLLDSNAGRHAKGNVLVCSMTSVNLRSPQRFRTYHGLPNQGPNCTIWEAVRATMAVPTVFKAIKIAGPGGFGPDHVSASLGFNNPTKQVRDEVEDLFGSDRHIGVLLSIGTGHIGINGFQQRNGMERALPSELIDVLQKITTDCERVADELAKEYDSDDIYFRFNILHGAGGISFDEWKKMDEIGAHTTSYLRGPEVSRQIDRIIPCLCCIQDSEEGKSDQFTIPVVGRSSIKLLKQIFIGTDYRLHSAYYGGKAVAVKIFEGRNAAQDCRTTAEREVKVMHSNVLPLIAKSGPREPIPFTIYGTSLQESAVQYIARSIPCSVEACFTAGATFIYSVASALDHLCTLDIPFHRIGIKDFTVFMDGANAVVLSFNACEFSNSTPSPSSLNEVAVDVFGHLCRQTFHSANKLLYRDHSVHNIDGSKAMDMPPTSESDDSAFSMPTTEAEISLEVSAPPRREITWESFTDNTIALKDIARQYQDILESSSFAPFYLGPEMRTTGVYRLVHRCQGYRREEVTLKPVIFDSKVVTHVTPALHEKCLICGRDVEEGVFNCVCRRPDDGVSPTVKCAKCLVWVHSRCNVDICRMCMLSNAAQPPQPHGDRWLDDAELSPIPRCDSPIALWPSDLEFPHVISLKDDQMSWEGNEGTSMTRAYSI